MIKHIYGGHLKMKQKALLQLKMLLKLKNWEIRLLTKLKR